MNVYVMTHDRRQRGSEDGREANSKHYKTFFNIGEMVNLPICYLWWLVTLTTTILTYTVNGNADNILLTINTSQVLIHFEDKLLVKYFVIDSFSFFRLTFHFCSSNSADFLEDLRESLSRLGKHVSSLP